MTEKKARQKVRGVYENPTGSDIWWILYYHDGKRHRERVGAWSHAVALYQKRKTQIRLGEKLPELQRRKILLGELLDDVIAYANERLKSARDYREKAELIRSSLGSRAADSITPADIEAFVRRRNVSAATFNRYRAFFSLCFREGIRSGKVQQNPARKIRQRREPGGRQRFLDREEEYPLLLQKLKTDMPGRVDEVVFSIQTGARLSEQYRLRWRSVDFAQRAVTFEDSKHGEDRSVPMNSVVTEILRRLAPGKPTPRGLVFGREHKPNQSPVWFRELLKSMGVDDYTWHNNRHTFCSWLAIAGTPLKTIQELAGHKTIAVTSRYAHLSPDHKRSELEKLAAPAKPKVVEITTATGTANR